MGCKSVLMWCFFIFYLVVQGSAKCPCHQAELCNEISGFQETEVFIFSLRPENAHAYDWSRITTIVEFGYHNDTVMCLAHSMNARVLTNANIDTASLANASARSTWVDKQVEFVKANFIDGINVDFESAIGKNETALRDGLTMLMKELTHRLKEESNNYMVSIDYAWSPNCIDDRCYDYKAIAEIVDVAFVMSYDERSQIYDECIAWANSPYNQTATGVKAYTDMGISNTKLVLGVPWYGYMYTCINYTNSDKCYIKPVPFRGAACSDAAGSQHNYGSVEQDLLPYSLTGLLWDTVAQSPYFTIKDHASGELKQVWFDDPKSLSIKYQYAKEMGLRGMGMWNADAIDYANIDQINAMWGALPTKKMKSK